MRFSCSPSRSSLIAVVAALTLAASSLTLAACSSSPQQDVALGSGTHNASSNADAGKPKTDAGPTGPTGPTNNTQTSNNNPPGKGSATIKGKPDGKAELIVKSTTAEIFDAPDIGSGSSSSSGGDDDGNGDQTQDPPSAPMRSLIVNLSDAADMTCSAAPKTETFRQIEVGVSFKPDAAFPAAKTYSVVGGTDASVSYGEYHPTDASGFMALEGSVTIIESNATHVKGSFSVTIDGNKVEGTFDAPMCPRTDTPKTKDGTSSSRG